MLFPTITFDWLGPGDKTALCGPFERTREEREVDDARRPRARHRAQAAVEVGMMILPQ
jgi:hypothetical protein